MRFDYEVLIIGGGAAGFYAAVQLAMARPKTQVAILERGKEVLGKVKVSGGGRCNVTHAQFIPSELAKNYPRGQKELLGPFHVHCSGDVLAFFEERGVPLKIEEDGRIFPKSDSSQSIIDCLQDQADQLGVTVLRNSPVADFVPLGPLDAPKGWEVTTHKRSYTAQKLVLTTGSSTKIWNKLESMGHTIVPPVPSLFTFNIKDDRITGLQGLATVAKVSVKPKSLIDTKISVQLKSRKDNGIKLESEGPLLITHWGMSGPAILKLSAWGARLLHDYHYAFKIVVNWLPDYITSALPNLLQEIRNEAPKKTVHRTKAFDLPNRLWIRLVDAAGIAPDQTWAQLSKEQIRSLATQLGQAEFQVNGKSTFKEEFVTAGGVELKEVDFKTYASKKLPHLYFAGEILDIDAITGGFNFQNAWTGGYIAAQAIAADLG